MLTSLLMHALALVGRVYTVDDHFIPTADDVRRHRARHLRYSTTIRGDGHVIE